MIRTSLLKFHYLICTDRNICNCGSCPHLVQQSRSAPISTIYFLLFWINSLYTINLFFRYICIPYHKPFKKCNTVNSQQKKLHLINLYITFWHVFGIWNNYLSIHRTQRIVSPFTNKSKALLISSKLNSCVIKPFRLSSCSSRNIKPHATFVSKHWK